MMALGRSSSQELLIQTLQAVIQSLLASGVTIPFGITQDVLDQIYAVYRQLMGLCSEHWGMSADIIREKMERAGYSGGNRFADFMLMSVQITLNRLTQQQRDTSSDLADIIKCLIDADNEAKQLTTIPLRRESGLRTHAYAEAVKEKLVDTFDLKLTIAMMMLRKKFQLYTQEMASIVLVLHGNEVRVSHPQYWSGPETKEQENTVKLVNLAMVRADAERATKAEIEHLEAAVSAASGDERAQLESQLQNANAKALELKRMAAYQEQVVKTLMLERRLDELGVLLDQWADAFGVRLNQAIPISSMLEEVWQQAGLPPDDKSAESGWTRAVVLAFVMNSLSISIEQSDIEGLRDERFISNPRILVPVWGSLIITAPSVVVVKSGIRNLFCGDLEKALIEFYRVHNPEKVPLARQFAAENAHNHAKLWAQLQRKYGGHSFVRPLPVLIDSCVFLEQELAEKLPMLKQVRAGAWLAAMIINNISRFANGTTTPFTASSRQAITNIASSLCAQVKSYDNPRGIFKKYMALTPEMLRGSCHAHPHEPSTLCVDESCRARALFECTEDISLPSLFYFAQAVTRSIARSPKLLTPVVISADLGNSYAISCQTLEHQGGGWNFSEHDLDTYVDSPPEISDRFGFRIIGNKTTVDHPEYPQTSTVVSSVRDPDPAPVVNSLFNRMNASIAELFRRKTTGEISWDPSWPQSPEGMGSVTHPYVIIVRPCNTPCSSEQYGGVQACIMLLQPETVISAMGDTSTAALYSMLQSAPGSPIIPDVHDISEVFTATMDTMLHAGILAEVAGSEKDTCLIVKVDHYVNRAGREGLFHQDRKGDGKSLYVGLKHDRRRYQREQYGQTAEVAIGLSGAFDPRTQLLNETCAKASASGMFMAQLCISAELAAQRRGHAVIFSQKTKGPGFYSFVFGDLSVQHASPAPVSRSLPGAFFLSLVALIFNGDNQQMWDTGSGSFIDKLNTFATSAYDSIHVPGIIDDILRKRVGLTVPGIMQKSNDYSIYTFIRYIVTMVLSGKSRGSRHGIGELIDNLLKANKCVNDPIFAEILKDEEDASDVYMERMFTTFLKLSERTACGMLMYTFLAYSQEFMLGKPLVPVSRGAADLETMVLVAERGAEEPPPFGMSAPGVTNATIGAMGEASQPTATLSDIGHRIMRASEIYLSLEYLPLVWESLRQQDQIQMDVAMLASMSPQERATHLASLSPGERAAAQAAMEVGRLASMSPQERATYLASLSPGERAAAQAAMLAAPGDGLWDDNIVEFLLVLFPLQLAQTEYNRRQFEVMPTGLARTKSEPTMKPRSTSGDAATEAAVAEAAAIRSFLRLTAFAAKTGSKAIRGGIQGASLSEWILSPALLHPEPSDDPNSDRQVQKFREWQEAYRPVGSGPQPCFFEEHTLRAFQEQYTHAIGRDVNLSVHQTPWFQIQVSGDTIDMAPVTLDLSIPLVMSLGSPGPDALVDPQDVLMMEVNQPGTFSSDDHQFVSPEYSEIPASFPPSHPTGILNPANWPDYDCPLVPHPPTTVVTWRMAATEWVKRFDLNQRNTWAWNQEWAVLISRWMTAKLRSEEIMRLFRFEKKEFVDDGPNSVFNPRLWAIAGESLAHMLGTEGEEPLKAHLMGLDPAQRIRDVAAMLTVLSLPSDSWWSILNSIVSADEREAVVKAQNEMLSSMTPGEEKAFLASLASVGLR